MKKIIVVGMIMMLVIVAILSGCTGDSKTTTYRGVIVKIVDESNWLSGGRYTAIFSDGRIRDLIEDSFILELLGKNVEITFYVSSLAGSAIWSIQDYRVIE